MLWLTLRCTAPLQTHCTRTLGLWLVALFGKSVDMSPRWCNGVTKNRHWRLCPLLVLACSDQSWCKNQQPQFPATKDIATSATVPPPPCQTVSFKTVSPGKSLFSSVVSVKHSILATKKVSLHRGQSRTRSGSQATVCDKFTRLRRVRCWALEHFVLCLFRTK